MTQQVTLISILCASLAACADSPSENVTAKVEQAIVSSEAIVSDAPVPLAPKALQELVEGMQAQVARNGDLRFSEPQLETPAAARLLLERLASGQDNQATRHALILSLSRTQGDYAADVSALLATERSVTLRAALVDSLRLAQHAEAALAGLKLGMADVDGRVRARAAFNAGRRSDGQSLIASLSALLDDQDSEVQAAAARALGQLGAESSFDALIPLLQSRQEDLRLEALRALARIDGKRATGLDALQALAQDSDHRIRRAAIKVGNQGY